MRIIILGGDGFCGWPTALHLSQLGHDILIVDNLSRRNIDNELEVSSLTPIQPMGTRLDAWMEVSGSKVEFRNLDVARDYQCFLRAIRDFQAESIIHFAEQRAAPY